MNTSASQNQEKPERRDVGFSILAIVGSLWFGGLLLMLLLVGMACATIFESSVGTERALATFYGAWWFKALLGLTGLNIAASIAVRIPLTRRQLGFVLTHGGLLAIMVGAVLTIRYGVDGHVQIVEGSTADDLQVDRDALELTNRRAGTSATVALRGSGFGGFEVVEHPRAETLTLGDLSIDVVKYLPDSTAAERLVDDNPRREPAVAVAFGGPGADSHWVFADKPERCGAVSIAYRVADSDAALEALLAETANAGAASIGDVQIVVDGQTYNLAVEACMAAPAPIGDTGRTVHVLQYLPHATVGEGNQLVNVSPEPVNPTLELEISGPQGTERRVCFAKFPDFQGMHGDAAQADVKATFIAKAASGASAPIEIIGAPDGRTFARFATASGKSAAQELMPEKPLATPWAGKSLTLLKRYEHARIDNPLEPVSPVREPRIPAVLVKLTSGGESSEMWVQRNTVRPVSVHGVPYELSYGNQSMPLGFQVKLNDFRVVHYPGGRQPRSFESDVTIVDPQSGDTQQRTISMNHPVSYGGFTLYQSSYNEGRGPALSIFGVSRDPGRWWVFAGYIATFVGMLLVLNNRQRERRLQAAQALTAGKR